MAIIILKHLILNFYLSNTEHFIFLFNQQKIMNIYMIIEYHKRKVKHVCVCVNECVNECI